MVKFRDFLLGFALFTNSCFNDPVVLDRVYFGNSEKFSRSLFEEKITEQFVSELSGAITVTSGEFGGYFYLKENTLGFYEVPNGFDRYKLDISSLTKSDFVEIDLLDRLEDLVKSDFVEGECSPYNASLNDGSVWRKKIREARINLDMIRLDPYDLDLRQRTADLLNEMVSNVYFGVRFNNSQFTVSNLVGGVHSHSNNTYFSEVDECSFRRSSGQFSFLVSYDGRVKDVFSIYFLQKSVAERGVLVGEYPVLNYCTPSLEVVYPFASQ